jgi:calcium-dependent protein kinase
MVVKGVHRITKQERAIKIVKKSKLANPDKFLEEIDITKKLVFRNSTQDHPNIIKLFETYEDKKFFYLVMEYLWAN